MRNGKPIAIILFVVVGLLIASMVQNQNVVALDTSFIKNSECLLNECITIFEIPNQLTEEEQALIDEVATVFFQDDLPLELVQFAEEQSQFLQGKSIKSFNEIFPIVYQQLSNEQKNLLKEYSGVIPFEGQFPEIYELLTEEQKSVIIGQRNLLAEQQATPQTNEYLNQPIESEDEMGKISRVGGVSLGLGGEGLNLVEKQTEPNVFTRGDIVKVVGKIILEKPAPYFMNINITCCEMSSFRAMSAVETDPMGNFVIKFATSMDYPLGNWKVVISTIGDNNKILNNVYDFKLIDEFGNER